MLFIGEMCIKILVTLVILLAVKTCHGDNMEKIPRCVANEPGDNRCTDMQAFYNRLPKRNVATKSVDWSNFVIIMLIHNDEEVDKLLDAHFNTWMKHVNGPLDIVFVSDVDDKRSYEQILPRCKEVTINCHLYKSAAKDDGKHIRYKVLDSLRYAENAFKYKTEKQYYLKMDTDTFIIPQTLLDYTNSLHSQTIENPLHYGWGCCYTKDLCYTAGSFYGFNRLGLEAVNRYMSQNEESFLKEVHHPIRFESKNLMDHEDFMISLSYRRATNIPMVNNRRMFPHLIERAGLGTEEKPPISYHKIKDAKLFSMYDALFYDEDGHLRLYEDTLKLMKFKAIIDETTLSRV